MGISRSASLLIAYLIKYRKMQLDETLRMLAKQRIIWPNDSFLEKLIQFHDNINKQNFIF